MGEKRKAGAWLPASEKPKEMLRDGEPLAVPLRRFDGEGCLRGSYWLGCCDCGLRHLNAVEIYRDGREFFAVLRFYRDDNHKSKTP